jgi:hypothetical protein
MALSLTKASDVKSFDYKTFLMDSVRHSHAKVRIVITARRWESFSRQFYADSSV